MPSRPWHRRWREITAASQGRARSQPPTAIAKPADNQPRDLHRAVSCYVRVGELAEAARCLCLLGEYEQAALFYLRLQDYTRAVQAYADARETEAAAWVHVHYLGEPEAARHILRRAEQQTGTLRGAPASANAARADHLLAWHDHIGLLRDHLSDPGPEAEAAVTIPGAGTAAAMAPTRHSIVKLAEAVIGHSDGATELAPFLAEVRELKRTAVSQDDWQARLCRARARAIAHQ